MKIAVASGKGGTGKTTVAVNLALSIGECTLLDCDVEEPNIHMLLKVDNPKETAVTVPTPRVQTDKCVLCQECSAFCKFNAIFVGRKFIIYDQLCHSCGGCKMVCPTKAIYEIDREVGTVYESTVGNLRVIYGTLNIGEPVATAVIKAVKEHGTTEGTTIIDSPPGTACPVIETVHDADYLILVTEPTPFGMHDLSMAIDVIRPLNIPFGVIVNKAGMGDYDYREQCEKMGAPIILEISFDRKIAELYSRGVPFVKELPEWQERFKELMAKIIKEARNNV